MRGLATGPCAHQLPHPLAERETGSVNGCQLSLDIVRDSADFHPDC